jgi:ABC-type dipeptide/oligopeptide/nickel transport system permease subunit
LFAIIQAAGWPIWFLLIASVISVTVIIERLLYLRAARILPPNLLPEVIAVTRSGSVDAEVVERLENNSPLGRVLAAGMRNREASREVMKEAIEEAGRAAAHQLERYLTTLGTIATLAPLMGLFGTVIGILTGALQGFFGGKTDLAMQRFIEVWSAMPELYLLIIFSAVFDPSIALLLILLGLFGWMGLSDYVRAEFLRNRQLDYVRAARALGLSNVQIMWRHVLPNSLTPVVTFLPFRMSAAILSLTSLDFLGLGVPPGTPSLGELLAQGKNNIDAWWISLFTFVVLVVTLMLLTFMGDALRDALDPRKAQS